VRRCPVFNRTVPFFWEVSHFPDKEKWDTKWSHFSTVLFFYNWYRFFIMACKQQLELRCLEWKSPSYFNKPLHVSLLALLWFVNLNLSNNRAFCVSAVRECLQLMYWSWVTSKFKHEIISAEALKLKFQHKSCINKAKCKLNLCLTPYYIIMVHGVFVQIMIWIPYLGCYWQRYSQIRLLTSFIVGE
jgi:hypothetical protein